MKLHLIIDTQIDETIRYARDAVQDGNQCGGLPSANYVTAIFAGFLPRPESNHCRHQTRSYERIGRNRSVRPGSILNVAF